ncbi:hypothetical protein BDV35DRAFT_381808 [Aspergillus flavus]|nr:unnamed protein product [Aspergillus oryzae RIB40]EIT76957.1 hypothetical protein Ao3042_06792 [Aspergillus oryzae 3.042]KAB8245081.1 hypothetical protein BDV35DRAFT_381808 [Aspergillus flavus]KDE84153.1 hypothetical protein AO1008_10758 [Aspergillus oryzae 100-8]BAE59685.1 unnamed protein product [Aspergillus oryzae RIB40]|eukprot:EIT76957.1 hypothetical protein Ao3042_06792 [Aspergillus oryzae 3.042]
MGGLSFLFIRPSWRLNEHAFCSDTMMTTKRNDVTSKYNRNRGEFAYISCTLLHRGDGRVSSAPGETEMARSLLLVCLLWPPKTRSNLCFVKAKILERQPFGFSTSPLFLSESDLSPFSLILSLYHRNPEPKMD